MPLTPDTPSVFERHPRLTLTGVWLVFLLLFLAVAEIGLKKISGLGRPVLFYQDPAFGYRLLPNQETWRFGGAHFKVNNLGLRAPGDWDARIDDKILFLGDSVTYGGNHISNHELFSARAAQGLPGLRSGNAGIPNWGVENVHGLVVLDRFLPASVYVTTFIEDDFYRGLQHGRNKPWIKYRMPRFALEELAEFVWYKYFTDTQEINRREREAEPADTRVTRAAAKLKEMDELLKSRGYRHLMFISPTRQEALGQRPVDARVKRALAAHRVDAIYLLDRLPAATPEERRAWYQDNDHLTARGHAVWAGLIHEELVRVLGLQREAVASR
jgi:hypothetical protein